MHVDPLAVERLVATLERLTHVSQEEIRIDYFNTHHVVRNQFEVPHIDFDAVDPKDATHLLHDSCTGHLYTICHKDSVDVVRVNIILLDQRLFGRTGSLPKAAEVGAVSGYLWSDGSRTIQSLAEKRRLPLLIHLCSPP